MGEVPAVTAAGGQEIRTRGHQEQLKHSILPHLLKAEKHSLETSILDTIFKMKLSGRLKPSAI